MHLIRQGWATGLMVFITIFFSPVTLPIFAALLVIWFLLKKQTKKAVLVIIGLGGGFLLEVGLKMIIARPRPPYQLAIINDYSLTSYSFPSGHAMLAIIFFAIMVYCFKDHFKNPLARRLYIIVNIFLCALVGFSRLYLGVHWFSDVIGGFIIGIIWFYLIKWLLRKAA